MFKEYGDYDALGLAELIRDGKVTATEVLEAALARPEIGVGVAEILGIIERKDMSRRAVDRDLVSGGFGRARVALEVQHAAGVLESPIDEHQLHDLRDSSIIPGAISSGTRPRVR